jgi:hypothetical protein
MAKLSASGLNRNIKHSNNRKYIFRMPIRPICRLAALALMAACQTPDPLPPTAFEASGGTQTETYASGMAQWEALARKYPELELQTYGPTDSGHPLHLAVLSPQRLFDPAELRRQGFRIVLVNNAIHPGEPDGVDASLRLCRSLLQGSPADSLGKTVLAIIPFYNIGGALQRNGTSRVNQEGPEAYGFRGNARNFDLNRDFVKCDTRNAASFAQLFAQWQPDVLVDTHVSNGADYQHVLTYISSQEDKMPAPLGQYMRESLTPALDTALRRAGFPLTPYVNVWGGTPDQGWPQFLDLPRYSTGYAALHHTVGYMTETHMLKPFRERVLATEAFLRALLAHLRDHGQALSDARAAALAQTLAADSLPLAWRLRPDRIQPIDFHGYEGGYKPSEATGLPRLFYDRGKPFRKPVPWQNRYAPAQWAKLPKAYLIPQAWAEVIERLEWNGVQMERLAHDTTLQAVGYWVEGYETSPEPFEGHYPHRNMKVRRAPLAVAARKGDVLVPARQPAARFLAAVLEPESPDSYACWNFFDIVLQRKEGFSPYVFEEKAAALLAGSDSLRRAFEAKRAADPDFAADGYAQLYFLYEHSQFAEAPYRRLPVFRLE